MKRVYPYYFYSSVVVVTANSQTFRGAITHVTDHPAPPLPVNRQGTESATGFEHTTTSPRPFSIQDIPLGFYKISIRRRDSHQHRRQSEVVAGTIYTLNVS